MSQPSPRMIGTMSLATHGGASAGHGTSGSEQGSPVLLAIIDSDGGYRFAAQADESAVPGAEPEDQEEGGTRAVESAPELAAR